MRSVSYRDLFIGRGRLSSSSSPLAPAVRAELGARRALKLKLRLHLQDFCSFVSLVRCW